MISLRYFLISYVRKRVLAIQRFIAIQLFKLYIGDDCKNMKRIM